MLPLVGGKVINTASYSGFTPNQEYFYPVRIVSRSVIRRRTRRISMLAFSSLLATSFISTFSPAFTIGAWKTVEHAPAASIAVLTPAPAIVVASVAPERPIMPQPPEKPIHNAPAYPLTLELKVENGDTLTNMLIDAGVSRDESQRAVATIDDVYDVRKLDVGQTISLKLDKSQTGSNEPVISSLILPVSATTTVQLTRKNDGFSVKTATLPLESKLKRAGGRIDSSLYETGVESGIPPALLEEIITAYSYDVDFQRDIQPGNSMDVLFERMETKTGAAAGHGNILFANLDLGERSLRIYRFVDKDGHADYYNEKGESLRKALLRTPINGARISSGFGMRLHPVLGYSRMHRGVDFAAPVGTPIYAAGDGVVEYAGIKGGYGNYMLIRHNGTYASAYGHISHFAYGMAPGRKVKQGEVVAYVGQTGMATGPHLHYEILVHDEQVNPAGVKFKTGNVLAGKDLTAFRKNVQHIEAQLASLPPHDGRLAMNVQQ